TATGEYLDPCDIRRYVDSERHVRVQRRLWEACHLRPRCIHGDNLSARIDPVTIKVVLVGRRSHIFLWNIEDRLIAPTQIADSAYCRTSPFSAPLKTISIRLVPRGEDLANGGTPRHAGAVCRQPRLVVDAWVVIDG